MQVSQDILTVLSAADVTGNTLRLVGQLDRAAYVAADKVLQAAGGKWDKRAKAHVFDGDAADALEPILLTGEVRRVKQDFGQFDSPPEVVERVIKLAQIEPGMAVLEPSAGLGNLALAAAARGGEVTCYEIDAKRCSALVKASAATHGIVLVAEGDFLSVRPRPAYDRVVMNPPFARQADIDHVRHAARFLKPGGRIVAVMSAGVMFRASSRTEAFRRFIARDPGLSLTHLPDNAFAASGTQVKTVVIAFTPKHDVEDA